ncbi:hypothetical protein X801_08732, partial [Opisthorchis viverrini]
THNPDKLELLSNYLSLSVCKSVSECTTSKEAVDTLCSIYAPTKSEIFARQVHHTCKQDNEQTLDQCVQKLRTLAVDCNYQSVIGYVPLDEAIRDAFISGIQSAQIRQRLSEHHTLTLRETVGKSKALESAYKQALSYQVPISSNSCNAAPQGGFIQDTAQSEDKILVSA